MVSNVEFDLRAKQDFLWRYSLEEIEENLGEAFKKCKKIHHIIMFKKK